MADEPKMSEKFSDGYYKYALHQQLSMHDDACPSYNVGHVHQTSWPEPKCICSFRSLRFCIDHGHYPRNVGCQGCTDDKRNKVVREADSQN